MGLPEPSMTSCSTCMQRTRKEKSFKLQSTPVKVLRRSHFLNIHSFLHVALRPSPHMRASRSVGSETMRWDENIENEDMDWFTDMPYSERKEIGDPDKIVRVPEGDKKKKASENITEVVAGELLGRKCC